MCERQGLEEGEEEGDEGEEREPARLLMAREYLLDFYIKFTSKLCNPQSKRGVKNLFPFNLVQ